MHQGSEARGRSLGSGPRGGPDGEPGAWGANRDRTHRLPKEMAPMEPRAFAAQLIARLEKLKREQDTRSTLEEKLQQIQEEEERDENGETHPLLPCSGGGGGGGGGGQCDEDPQAILDEHLSRVLKTPGCQSPGLVRYSPRSRSPERCDAAAAAVASLPTVPFPGTKHIHHHYVHHHAGPRTKEQTEAEAAQRVQCLCPPGSADFAPVRCSTLSKRPAKLFEEGMSGSPLPLDTSDRSQNVWQWILESERQGKHKPHSTQSLKKSHPVDSPTKTLPGRTHAPWGGGGLGSGGHLRSHHPGHPFIQDPAMPPLPPPNTLAQLEEACRRLEEVSKPPKQRHSAASGGGGGLQRDRSHSTAACPSGGTPPACSAVQTDLSKELMVTYFFCGEEIPYRSMMKAHSLTLGHFKEQLSKKGNYRYYFKKASDEFECGAVFEEVADDVSALPMYEGKVLGKVEKMD
ncbi:axin-2-like [Gadus chalcogrammus]|uniref:axin-2-like n=1 Tax=Gadus chalcogrammus TaxID=1042646 RepID=UPI0024C30CB0|nr:axin-2-like [Gadus chalcogrammus]